MSNFRYPCMGRRAFLSKSVPLAVAGGAVASMLTGRGLAGQVTVTGGAKGELTLPGPFPGRVIEAYHAGSVVDGLVQREPVRQMVARGMQELAGATDATEAWRRFFEPGDVVGVKVNPIGAPRAMSSHELVHEVVAGLKSAGVPAKDIIIFTRYRRPFERAGYLEHLPEGVRTNCAAEDYDNVQLDIAGYDPDVFREIDLVSARYHDPRDERTRRSHLCLTVSRKVNKVINLPVLKDHGAAGVTLALKNLSHGLVNNVQRSHSSASTNACDTFIPAIVSMPEIRSKVVLHILDATNAVYQGGPSAPKESTWSHRTLYFGTDPVAMDRIGWEVIDAKRKSVGLPVVAEARLGQPQDDAGRRTNSYRQPQHIEIAAALGLGVYKKELLDHRRLVISAG